MGKLLDQGRGVGIALESLHTSSLVVADESNPELSVPVTVSRGRSRRRLAWARL